MIQGENKEIRIMLADDHALIRQGLIKVLSLEPTIQVVAEAENGREAIEKALQIPMDVVLMDINMPLVDGITAVKEIKEVNPDLKIIALTIHDQEEYLVELIKLGVAGYVLKDVSPDELVKAIHQVMNGDSYIPPVLMGKVLKELNRLSAAVQQPDPDKLTFRELEILQELALGLSNKEIADKLFISEKTVKNHLTNIFQKCGVTDRTQAVLHGLKHNWIQLS
ncbi:MAG: response regulator transcription factor [Bacillota bacterium]|nr:response regulator transcription factor [Bacillota bacterium]MDW7677022.1 response regulator transcription factor [Bacillota bacterium]